MLDTKFLSDFTRITKMQNSSLWTMKFGNSRKKSESLFCIALVWFEFENMTSIYRSRILNGKWRRLAWTWATCLQGQERHFCHKCKWNILLTMVKISLDLISLIITSHLIFISSNLSQLGDKASRRRICKKWLVTLKYELEIHGFWSSMFQNQKYS